MKSDCRTCQQLVQKIHQHEEIIAQLVEMIAHVNKDMKRVIEIQSSLAEKQNDKRFVSIL